MFPERIVKIILKRCDATTKSNTKPKQNCAPKVRNKNSCNFPAATVEVKSEFIEDEVVSTCSTKGKTSNTVTDDSPKPAADHRGGTVRGRASDPQVNVGFSSNDLTDYKQFGFRPTDVVVKVERVDQNNLSTGELVGSKGEDDLFKTEADDREVVRKKTAEARAGNVSARFNSPTDLDQSSCPPTNLRIKTEQVEEEEGAVENELVYPIVVEDPPNINDAEFPAGNVNVLPDKWENGTQTIKVEEGLITSELVARLPKGLKDDEGDNKLPLKAAKGAESQTGAKNKPRFDLNRFSGIRGNSSSKKVTSKKYKAKLTQAGNSETLRTLRSSEKRFECFHCGAKFRRKTAVREHICCMHSENVHTCAHCSAQFRTERSMASHIIKHFGGKPFSCPHCPMTFKHKYGLKLHLMHLSGEVQCPSGGCLMKFSSRCSLRAHLRSMHSEDKKPFSCPYCSKTFSYRCALVVHLMPGTEEIQCPSGDCLVKFLSRCSLRVHVLSVHSDGKHLYGDQCPAQFSQKECVKQQLSVHSDEKNFACVQCPSKFTSYSALCGHLKTHTKERPYGCDFCSCRFKIKHGLKRHLNVVHLGTEKPFACDQCSARFHRKDALKEHFLVHSKEKSFACDQCPAKFNTSSKLKRHASVHSTERPFMCEKCPKSFKMNRTLQRHARIHSGVNLHSCDQCPAKFVAPFLLKEHLEAVHSDKTFACEKCSRRLKSKQCLQHHLKKVHSSKRPYSCSHCSLTFLSSRRLKAHSTLHTGQRRFSCAQCPAKFMERGDLKKHSLVHADVKPLICAHCSGRYRCRNSLLTHLKKCLKGSSLASVSK